MSKIGDYSSYMNKFRWQEPSYDDSDDKNIVVDALMNKGWLTKLLKDDSTVYKKDEKKDYVYWDKKYHSVIPRYGSLLFSLVKSGSKQSWRRENLHYSTLNALMTDDVNTVDIRPLGLCKLPLKVVKNNINRTHNIESAFHLDTHSSAIIEGTFVMKNFAHDGKFTKNGVFLDKKLIKNGQQPLSQGNIVEFYNPLDDLGNLKSDETFYTKHYKFSLPTYARSLNRIGLRYRKVDDKMVDYKALREWTKDTGNQENINKVKEIINNKIFGSNLSRYKMVVVKGGKFGMDVKFKLKFGSSRY